MSLSSHEFWTVLHGMVFGALFLLAFAGGLAGLYSLRPGLVTEQGLAERIKRLKAGTVGMAVVAWATVITGTWIVYPWYRAEDPNSPRSLLKADPDKVNWHDFGMEWKEHIAWIAPLLATVVAFMVIYYKSDLIKNEKARRIALVLFVLAFATAAVAGAFGAFLNKVAPVK